MSILKVDSLIKIHFDMTGRQSMDSALMIIQQAEKLAKEKIGNSSYTYGKVCFLYGQMLESDMEAEQAGKWYKDAETILRRIPEKRSLLFSACLNRLAILSHQRGEFEKAKPYYQEEIEIRNQLGQNKIEFSSSILNLAMICQETKDYAHAETHYLAAKELMGQSPDLEKAYAACENSLAGLYYILGKNDQADSLFRDAITIQRKLVENSPSGEVKTSGNIELAETMNNLAKLYARMERLDAAFQWYAEAKDIRVKSYNPRHPVVAGSMIDMAQLHVQMGQFTEAEELLIQARQILESQEMANNKYMKINCMTHLADLYSRLGQYNKAEILFPEIRESADESLQVDPTDPISILCISKLGLFYQSLGDEEKAEAHFKEHLQLLEASLKLRNKKKEESQEYGESLNILANLYAQQGRDRLARPLYEEALEIIDSTGNSKYATLLTSLASLEVHSGQLDAAELLFLRAMDIYANTLGKEHPYYAGTVGNLGSLYISKGEFEKAEPLCLQARDIFKEQYGRQHPEYVFVVKSLANLYERQERYVEADSLLEEVFVANEARIAMATSFMSEQELEKYIKLFQSDGNDLYAYLYARTANGQELSRLAKLAYDHTLYYKGFLLLAARRLSKLATSTEESIRLYEKLKSYRKKLAFQYAKPITSRRGVDVLEADANATEKELTKLVAGYGEALQQVRWAQVQTTLQDDEVVIEFIHFRQIGQAHEDSVRYGALIIRPQSTGPEFVSLCKEEELGELVRTKSTRGSEYVNKLYSITHRGWEEVPTDASSKTLYELIWEPLEKRGLTDVQKIYYSPTGLLHRINLGAIPISKDSVVTNRYQMIMVNSSRQIPAQQSDRLSGGTKSAQLFGAIQFDPPANAIGTSSSTEPDHGDTNNPTERANANSQGFDQGWPKLDWTADEIKNIKDVLEQSGYSIQSTTGMGATEEYVKEIGQPDHLSPAIIHIATHGFFFEEPEEGEEPVNSSQAIFIHSEQPMMRSGLILSGANFAWKNGRPIREGFEDGILTAYEISQMDLSQTELVALSACETGLGDIKGNEGVYGLQRAFKIAGVKYLIMTLWKVDDEATAFFMIEFYKHLLIDKKSVPEAFRMTQLEFLKIPFSKPYLWAGFVLLE